jgi:hypothetical protein
MSGQRFGMAYISVDGSQLATMPGAKLDIGGVERTTVTGDNQVLGFTRAPKPAVLECEISIGVGTSLTKLAQITGATVTFECDTGQTYVMREAFVTKTLALTAGDSGKVALEMAGMPAEEMGV